MNDECTQSTSMAALTSYGADLKATQDSSSINFKNSLNPKSIIHDIMKKLEEIERNDIPHCSRVEKED